MEDTTEPAAEKHLGRRTAEDDLELWKHYASFGGEDKNRMVLIASWLLGFSAVILGQLEKHLASARQLSLMAPELGVLHSLSGMAISFAAGYVALLYGGYSNRNWKKADEIAFSRSWDDLLPPQPMPKQSRAERSRRHAQTINNANGPQEGPDQPLSYRGRLNNKAYRLARPCDPKQELAPVFEVFLTLAVVFFTLHVAVLIWSVITLMVYNR